MSQDFLIIDGHTHTYKDHVAARIMSTFTENYQMNPTSSVGFGTVHDVLSNMEQYHIDYTIIANFAPEKSALDVNNWTLSIAERNPNLIPLISVYPGMSVELIKEYIARGAKGIKMHTGVQSFEPDDSELQPIYELCSANSIPILFHCGETSRVHVNDFAAMNHIYPVLKKYTKIPFVLAHMAAGEVDEVYHIARTCSHVFFETSITITGEHCIDRIHDNYWEDDTNVVKAFRDIGCDRVIFGSDYPFGNPGSDIKRILSLELTKAEKRMVLGENSYNVYKIGPA